jgi:arginase family enzyme
VPHSTGNGTTERDQHLGLRGLNIVGGDVVCMMPTKDSPNNIIALTASAIMFEMISMIAENTSAARAT